MIYISLTLHHCRDKVNRQNKNSPFLDSILKGTMLLSSDAEEIQVLVFLPHPKQCNVGLRTLIQFPSFVFGLVQG